MKHENTINMTDCIKGFRLPAYCEIPDVGLYLEQTVKYINSFLEPLPDTELTASMVSNYVKRGLIDNAVKKQYSREQIARLIYITVIKTVLSLENVQLMFRLQKDSYPNEVAYNYFREELGNMLNFVFGRTSEPANIGVDSSEEKIMLRNAVIAAAHKIYLDRYFAAVEKSAGK